MPHDNDHIRIGDQAFRLGHRLGWAALIIERRQLQPIAGKNLALRIRLLDGQLRAVQHVLAFRRLIAGQRADETDLDDRLRFSTPGEQRRPEKGEDVLRYG